jgi:hypothetical protein
MNARKFWKQDSQPKKLFAVVASMQSMFSVFKDFVEDNLSNESRSYQTSTTKKKGIIIFFYVEFQRRVIFFRMLFESNHDARNDDELFLCTLSNVMP